VLNGNAWSGCAKRLHVAEQMRAAWNARIGREWQLPVVRARHPSLVIELSNELIDLIYGVRVWIFAGAHTMDKAAIVFGTDAELGCTDLVRDQCVLDSGDEFFAGCLRLVHGVTIGVIIPLDKGDFLPQDRTSLQERDMSDKITANIIPLIDRATNDPTLSFDQLERLFAMRERALISERETQFAVAFHKAQSEMQPIVKRSSSEQTRSKYAALDAIADSILPIVHSNGFAPSYGTDVSPLADHIRIVCDLLHVSGYTKRYHADIPIDNVGLKGNANKTLTHAFGSTISYGRRYLIVLIFNLILIGEDNDGNRPQQSSVREIADPLLITPAQVKELTTLANSVKADLRKFLDYFGLESLAQIRVVDFDRAKAALNKKRQSA
jgi:ERF superfamily